MEIILYSDLERYVDEKFCREFGLNPNLSSSLRSVYVSLQPGRLVNKAAEHICGYEMKAERAAQVL